MSTEKIAIHWHDYVISLDTFKNCPKMVENMLITQTDTANRLPLSTRKTCTYVNSYEAKNYPIYTTMYHPEYSIADVPKTDFRK